MDQNFEDLTVDELADLLRKFYGTVLSKQGKEYSKSGMINLRSGLNRYLQSVPFKKTYDLMNDQVFLQANKVFSGCLRDNKERGLDTSQPRQPIEQSDLEKLFRDYFRPGIENNNTEVLLHKVFFDIIYFTGRRGKEGLSELCKNSFQIKTGSDGKEFIEITFNEKTKKNQGDGMSAGLNALHNDHQIITEQPGNDLCSVKSFKKCISLLHPDITAFFQYPNKSKKSFTRECVGKNSLGTMMKTIPKQANLSKTYTNHSIRKTTATAMYRSGFSLKEISHVTKHKNLDSLKHYISGPTHTDKETYSNALFDYARKEKREIAPKRSQQAEEMEETTKRSKNIEKEIVPSSNVLTQSASQEGQVAVKTSTHNQLRQAANLFQNASFANCNFTFNIPQ